MDLDRFSLRWEKLHVIGEALQSRETIISVNSRSS